MLRAAGRLGLLAFRLPAVVLQELVDHRRRDLLQVSELERKLERLRQEVTDQADDDSALPLSERRLDEAQINGRCSNYADDVRAWFEEVGSVLDHPVVPHRELVDRILARRRPFGRGEVGYRDALIWYSSLECAASGPVILLTANTKDFAGEADGVPTLADDLVADLAPNEIQPGGVTLLTSTSALLQAVLPEWDDQGVHAAWSAFLMSQAGSRAIDQLLDVRLGRELAKPPTAAPPWLWAVGVRSVTRVTSVEEVQSVPDSDEWHRVRARVSCSGRIGGYAWSWGDPDADAADLVVWDDWGGLTTYYASENETTVGLVVGARFRNLIDVEQFDISDAYVPADRAATDSSDELSRVHRSLSALLAMLSLHGDRPEFLSDVLGDSADEFEMVVSGLVGEWEDVCDQVPGRYTTLTVDNVATALLDQAGLSALRADLRLAVEAIESKLSSSRT